MKYKKIQTDDNFFNEVVKFGIAYRELHAHTNYLSSMKTDKAVISEKMYQKLYEKLNEVKAGIMNRFSFTPTRIVCRNCGKSFEHIKKARKHKDEWSPKQ